MFGALEILYRALLNSVNHQSLDLKHFCLDWVSISVERSQFTHSCFSWYHHKLVVFVSQKN